MIEKTFAFSIFTTLCLFWFVFKSINQQQKIIVYGLALAWGLWFSVLSIDVFDVNYENCIQISRFNETNLRDFFINEFLILGLIHCLLIILNFPRKVQDIGDVVSNAEPVGCFIFIFIGFSFVYIFFYTFQPVFWNMPEIRCNTPSLISP